MDHIVAVRANLNDYQSALNKTEKDLLHALLFKPYDAILWAQISAVYELDTGSDRPKENGALNIMPALRPGFFEDDIAHYVQGIVAVYRYRKAAPIFLDNKIMPSHVPMSQGK